MRCINCSWSTGAHASSVSVYVRNIKKCLGILKSLNIVNLHQVLNDYVKAQNKRWQQYIQSAWSKQRDGGSLAHDISAADAGRLEIKAAFPENYSAVSVWILNQSSIKCHEEHQPFSLSGILFRGRVILISGLALKRWKKSFPLNSHYLMPVSLRY